MFIYHGFTRIDLVFENKNKYDVDYTKITGIGTIVIYNNENSVHQLETGVVVINKKEKFEESISLTTSKVNLNTFMINRKNFILNQNNHSYLSQKIFIDYEYNIKNSLESPEIYGNINKLCELKLEEIINSKSFKKYDYATKDKFIDCSICEYRYCCNDNRLPYQRSQNEWYHKTECNYNPYICKWQGEEGYLTLEECGVISNEHGFSIDHEKIAEINKQLWGE